MATYARLTVSFLSGQDRCHGTDALTCGTDTINLKNESQHSLPLLSLFLYLVCSGSFSKVHRMNKHWFPRYLQQLFISHILLLYGKTLAHVGAERCIETYIIHTPNFQSKGEPTVST